MKGEKYEIVIVGGSYAGMSAALALGRSQRKVLVVDGMNPCNKPTAHSHNFLTQDGSPPSKIASIARKQVLEYPSVEWLDDNVYDIMGESDDFEVSMDRNGTVLGKRIILATGLKDLLPNIPGFSECWGKTIIHCPYCHGYEFSDQKTGILVPGDQALEMVKLINNWTKDLTLFLNGTDDLNSDHQELIRSKSIRIVENEIKEVIHHEGKLQHLIMNDGSEESLVALYSRVPTEQKLTFLKNLGCEITESNHIEVDMFGKTTIDCVYAVGDCAHPMRSVAAAVYTGNISGAMLNKELIEEDF